MTAAVGLPLEVDQTIYQHATWQVQYRWVVDEVGVDFTGWTGRMQVRHRPGGQLLLDLTTSNGGITLTGDGLITLTASAAQTGALHAAAGTGDAVYDVVLTDPDGRRTRFLQGAVDIVPAVTVP